MSNAGTAAPIVIVPVIVPVVLVAAVAVGLPGPDTGLVLVLMLAGLLLREDRDGDRDDRAGLLRWRLLVCNRVPAIDED